MPSCVKNKFKLARFFCRASIAGSIGVFNLVRSLTVVVNDMKFGTKVFIKSYAISSILSQSVY